MNPLFAFFAGGTGILVGLLLIILAVFIDILVEENTRVVWLIRLMAIAGAIFLGGSSPALEKSVFWLWVILFASWRFESNSGLLSRVRLRHWVLIIFLGFNLILLAASLQRYQSPAPPAQRPQRIVVLGDSLTAGINFGETDNHWPEIVEQNTDIDFEVLARPGAKLSDGLWLLSDRISDTHPEGTLFLILLGGNDILGATKSEKYKQDLDKLYNSLPAASPVYAFEIPAPPFKGDFNLIQRKTAASHGVNLIPRRHISATLAPAQHTIDGIHLTGAGHLYLADLIIELLDI